MIGYLSIILKKARLILNGAWRVMNYLVLVAGVSFSLFGALPPASKKIRIGVVRNKKSDVQDCLSRGESPVSTWPRAGMTPLMMALKWNKTDIAALLATVQLSEQAQLQNYSNQTPLHFAAEAANLSMLKALLDAGASINHLDANGIAPLYAAIKGLCAHHKPEYLQVIKLLLNSGAYIYAEKQTLWDLVLSTHNQEVIDLLAPYFIKQKVI